MSEERDKATNQLATQARRSGVRYSLQSLVVVVVVLVMLLFVVLVVLVV